MGDMSMVTRKPLQNRLKRAFTLTELLVVIAIIAVLAAILFPVMATVREQARQSSTMSNLYSAYVGARLYYEDEGHFPNALFGYAEVADATVNPPFRPMLPADIGTLQPTPMDQLHGAFRTYRNSPNESVFRGFLYHEQVKDLNVFLNQVNAATSKTSVTVAYYPINSPLGAGGTIDGNGVLHGGKMVTWSLPLDPSVLPVPPCTNTPDSELPDATASSPYRVDTGQIGKPKLYYAMDSLDIGPMLTPDGKIVKDEAGLVAYELHYSPDWSKQVGLTCDGPRVTQLKYKNPPQDKTILTYVTHHSAYSRQGTVIAILLNGTARKISSAQAFEQLPLGYH